MATAASAQTGAVQFDEEKWEKKDERKKFLTMKYGQHQLKLIQKRLKVEFWLDIKLRDMFEIEDDNETYPCDPDLDEMLDIETDTEREEHVRKLVENCDQPQKTKEEFVAKVIEKLKTL